MRRFDFLSGNWFSSFLVILSFEQIMMWVDSQNQNNLMQGYRFLRKSWQYYVTDHSCLEFDKSPRWPVFTFVRSTYAKASKQDLKYSYIIWLLNTKDLECTGIPLWATVNCDLLSWGQRVKFMFWLIPWAHFLAYSRIRFVLLYLLSSQFWKLVVTVAALLCLTCNGDTWDKGCLLINFYRLQTLYVASI